MSLYQNTSKSLAAVDTKKQKGSEGYKVHEPKSELIWVH